MTLENAYAHLHSECPLNVPFRLFLDQEARRGSQMAIALREAELTYLAVMEANAPREHAD